MSVELLTQVRSYYEQIDERQTPIRPDEIAQLLENLYDLPAKPLPLRRPRPELWVAAAAAVVLVVALGTWLFSRSEPDDTIVDQPTTTTTAETLEDALSDEGFTIIFFSL